MHYIGLIFVKPLCTANTCEVNSCVVFPLALFGKLRTTCLVLEHLFEKEKKNTSSSKAINILLGFAN